MDNHSDRRNDYNYPLLPGGGLDYTATALWRFPYNAPPQGRTFGGHPMSPVSPTRSCTSVSPSAMVGGVSQRSVFQFHRGCEENPTYGRLANF